MGSGVSLYNYQLDAVRRMKNGCILCGGVGSGKSRTSLAYYYLKNGGMLSDSEYIPMCRTPQDLYIITTARKRDTFEWEGELATFMLSTDPEHTMYTNRVIVDSWNNIGKYTDAKNAFFIFDEQRVVGSGAWVKSFLKIARLNEWILLSATPGDTWLDYIPVFLANGFYKNRTAFLSEHVVYSRFSKFPKVDRYLGVGKLLRFRNDILVTMDFERKTQSHHQDIFVEYDRSMYHFAGKNRKNPFEKGYAICGEKDDGALLVGTDIESTEVYPMLRAWDGFDVEDGDYVKEDYEPLKNASGLCYVWRRIANEDISRQTALLEIFEKHQKLIVFYNFDYELEILKGLEYGTGSDVEVAEWNGHKHQPIPEGDAWVYLVQYTAGAEGWNCIKTDTIVFYSQNYSYKIMQQSAGRIDRLNTPFQDLYYYHLKSRSGIDMAISKALREKRNFNESKFMEGR